MDEQKKPELYVVGAGPGDPELITVKAYKTIAAGQSDFV